MLGGRRRPPQYCTLCRITTLDLGLTYGLATISLYSGVGPPWLFPHPMLRRHHDGPATRHLAAYWLKRAYELSGATKPDGSMWHAFRRL
jgi:hypothetical protein